MKTIVDELINSIKNIWEPFPEIPYSVLNRYKAGLVDNDPTFAQLFADMHHVEFDAIASVFVVACEALGLMRVAACACYELCLLNNNFNQETSDWLDAFIDRVSCAPMNKDDFEDLLESDQEIAMRPDTELAIAIQTMSMGQRTLLSQQLKDFATNIECGYLPDVENDMRINALSCVRKISELSGEAPQL